MALLLSVTVTVKPSGDPAVESGMPLSRPVLDRVNPTGRPDAREGVPLA